MPINMRIIFTLAFLTLSTVLLAQGTIAVANTRLVAGCMLNDSSFAVSATEVEVLVNPQAGEIFVRFDNANARDMSKNAELYYAKRPIIFEWKASFFGLEEMLRNSAESRQQANGNVQISIGDKSQELPASLLIESLNGTQGITNMVTLKGTFDPNYFEMNSDEFVWDEEFTYSIIFRTTAY